MPYGAIIMHELVKKVGMEYYDTLHLEPPFKIPGMHPFIYGMQAEHMSSALCLGTLALKQKKTKNLRLYKCLHYYYGMIDI
jgi:hypothetical protein